MQSTITTTAHFDIIGLLIPPDYPNMGITLEVNGSLDINQPLVLSWPRFGPKLSEEPNVLFLGTLPLTVRGEDPQKQPISKKFKGWQVDVMPQSLRISPTP